MAALLVREDLDVTVDRALGHYTHEKSSVGCAAALATIECLFEDRLIENARALGRRGLERLIEIKAKYPLVHDIRGLGLFFGIELRIDNQPSLQAAEDILYHSLSQGLSYKIGAGCVLTLCPPLTLPKPSCFQHSILLNKA